MSLRWRGSVLAALSATVLVLAACGGDDSAAEQKPSPAQQAAAPTPAPTERVATATSVAAPAGTANPGSAQGRLLLNCNQSVTRYRFDGQLALKMPAGAGGSGGLADSFAPLLEDVKLSGARIEPDRTQMRLELGSKSANSPLAGQAVEVITIGANTWTRLGQTPWQQSDAGGLAGQFESFTPGDLCDTLSGGLPQVTGRKERVNGVDATRYDYTRKDLASGTDILGGEIDSFSDLKLSVWVTDKEQFPAKVVLDATGDKDLTGFTVKLELNTSEINAPSISINAPR